MALHHTLLIFTGLGWYPTTLLEQRAPLDQTPFLSSSLLATRRAPEQNTGKTQLSVGKIIEFLRSRDAHTKPRDLHEVEALAEILEARTEEQVFEIAANRLSIIYTATTRGWKEAQSFARKELEEQIGLPAVVHQPTNRPFASRGRRHAPPRSKKS